MSAAACLPRKPLRSLASVFFGSLDCAAAAQRASLMEAAALSLFALPHCASSGGCCQESGRSIYAMAAASDSGPPALHAERRRRRPQSPQKKLAASADASATSGGLRTRRPPLRAERNQCPRTVGASAASAAAACIDRYLRRRPPARLTFCVGCMLCGREPAATRGS